MDRAIKGLGKRQREVIIILLNEGRIREFTENLRTEYTIEQDGDTYGLSAKLFQSISERNLLNIDDHMRTVQPDTETFIWEINPKYSEKLKANYL